MKMQDLQRWAIHVGTYQEHLKSRSHHNKKAIQKPLKCRTCLTILYALNIYQRHLQSEQYCQNISFGN